MSSRGKYSASRRRRSMAAYTLVEVMMSLGILTMGAVGIMGLQQASTRGNLQAREISTANNVLRTWMERVKRDSLMWTVGGTGAAAADLSATQYLSQVGTGWFEPAPVSAAESAAFTHTGQDTAVAAQKRFCTNVRFEWMEPGQAIRAEVRVWWPRSNITAPGDYFDCANGTEPTSLSGNAELHFINAVNVVRWNPI